MNHTQGAAEAETFRVLTLSQHPRMLPKLLGPAGLSGGVKPGACGGFRVLMDLFEADGITKACLLAGDSFFLV